MIPENFVLVHDIFYEICLYLSYLRIIFWAKVFYLYLCKVSTLRHYFEIFRVLLPHGSTASFHNRPPGRPPLLKVDHKFSNIVLKLLQACFPPSFPISYIPGILCLKFTQFYLRCCFLLMEWSTSPSGVQLLWWILFNILNRCIHHSMPIQSTRKSIESFRSFMANLSSTLPNPSTVCSSNLAGAVAIRHLLVSICLFYANLSRPLTTSPPPQSFGSWGNCFKYSTLAVLVEFALSTLCYILNLPNEGKSDSLASDGSFHLLSYKETQI